MLGTASRKARTVNAHKVIALRIVRFHERLVLACGDRGLDLKQLARACGVSADHLYKVCAGSELSLQLLEQIERQLGLSREYWAKPTSRRKRDVWTVEKAAAELQRRWKAEEEK